tara:strand:- start:21911 stop:22591 length:681 start_codon:yes stop_codon:yes gene_type:complete
MGIEMVLLLVDEPCLKNLLQQTWEQLYDGMEKGKFRDNRPAYDPRLKRAFDIDCEAEILDWMDSVNPTQSDSVIEVLKSIPEGSQGLLQLMEWSSPGAWEVWEGRAFLYLDVALKRTISSSDDLYSEETWTQLIRELNGLPEDEFSEAVCLDWMDRRKELGETLDENEDPKIVPTFEAHDRASRALVYTITLCNSKPELLGILGREHLNADFWGHGRWNLRQYLLD